MKPPVYSVLLGPQALQWLGVLIAQESLSLSSYAEVAPGAAGPWGRAECPHLQCPRFPGTNTRGGATSLIFN